MQKIAMRAMALSLLPGKGGRTKNEAVYAPAALGVDASPQKEITKDPSHPKPT